MPELVALGELLAAGALITTRRGAILVLPTAEQVVKFLAAQDN